MQQALLLHHIKPVMCIVFRYSQGGARLQVIANKRTHEVFIFEILYLSKYYSKHTKICHKKYKRFIFEWYIPDYVLFIPSLFI